MTIEEAQILKLELESNIKTLVDKFEKDTDLTIHHIDVNRFALYGKRKTVLSKIDCDTVLI